MTHASTSSNVLSQLNLNTHYLRKLAAPEFSANVPEPDEDARWAIAERRWMKEEEQRCDLTVLPQSPSAFLDWYRALFKRQLAQSAGLFDHLASSASLTEMALYICLEEQVDGRFDDVIALAQIGLGGDAKLALARNYWDEMGAGRREEMHTHLFNQSAAYFKRVLARSVLTEQLAHATEALKNGNMLLLMALNRRYALRLIGALTLLEHTAPHRFSRVVQGMRRLDVPESTIYYHEMHIRVDARHGDDLLNDIVTPMVSRQPDVIREIALGMLIRCNIATDYYDRIGHFMDMS